MNKIKAIFKSKISHKIFKNSIYIIISILIGVTAVYASSTTSLTPPGPASNTMYSLTDIYNLATGTTATEGTGTISATPGTVELSGKSLTDVYTAISSEITAIDGTKILTGTTIFGVDGNAVGLPKTGQTHCNAYSGGIPTQIPCTGTTQDGELQIGLSHDYVDNSDGTISDNSTGLMWQKCIDGQSGTDCSIGSTNAFPFDDGNGNLGIVHQPALSYCDSLILANHDDWRLPNIKELVSIVDYGQVIPAIDHINFPNAESAEYWSSTAFKNDADNVWVVNFPYGTVDLRNLSGYNYVRCVR